MGKNYSNKYSSNYSTKNTNGNLFVEVAKVVIPAIATIAVALLGKKK